MSKRKIVALGCVLSLALSSLMASARTDDAVVFADFEGEGVPVVGQTIPSGEAGNVWLNGVEDTTLTFDGSAMKMEMGATGYVGIGNPAVQMRTADGSVAYQYLVIRIKGETGGENRMETGGLMISIGGAEGSHVRALNDRSVGTAAPALGRDGNPLPEITTEYQNFVIALNDQNIRDAEASKCISINFNNVMNPVTLYIDDIYFTNTYPSDAAEYTPPTTPADPSEPDTPAEPSEPDAPDESEPAESDTPSAPESGAESEQEESESPDSSSGSSASVPSDSSAADDTSSPASRNDGGLSTGAIIGIVAAVVVVLGGGAAALYFFVIRKKIA